MADVHDSKTRSRNMAAIRGKDTRPELVVRRGLHAKGFRYRLHSRKLPGRPDIVFPKYAATVFVNGCFWHGHDCTLFKWPKTREDFWRDKISGNVERDRSNLAELRSMGWRYAVVWECALKGKGRLTTGEVIDTIADWLFSATSMLEIRGKTAEI